MLRGLAAAGCLLALTACTAEPVRPTAQVLPATSSPTTASRNPAVHPSPIPVIPRATVPPKLVFGGDISWPQCPLGTVGALPQRVGKGLPLPSGPAQFVVIGLTNGPGFYPNPCLAWEVEQARLRHLWTAAYSFITLPTPAQVTRFGGRGPYSAKTALGRLRNAADAQAAINLDSLRQSGLRTPIIWMDVEPQDLAPWGADAMVNREVLFAARKAYRRAGFATGFYSSATPWKKITGGLQDPGPTWVSAGPRGRAAAQAMCSAPAWSGGQVVLAQYWPDDTQDLDLTCAPAQQDPTRYFAAP